MFFCVANILCTHANVADSISSSIDKDTISIDEVTVSAYNEKPISGTITGKIRLLPEKLQKIPAILGNTDVLKLLELTPGVQTAGDANTSLYVRGGDPGQNLLILDNAFIYTPGHLLGFFPLFNADHLYSLELMKSGMNAEFGGRLSSVIDVKSLKNIPQHLSVKGNVGLISSQATIGVPLSDKWGLHLSFRKTYLELMMQPLLNTTVNSNAQNKVDDTFYGFWDGNMTLVGKLSDTDKLLLHVFSGNDKLEINENDILLDGAINWKNKSFSLEWDKQLGEKMSFEQSIFYSQYDNTLKSIQAQMGIDVFSSVKNTGYKNKFKFLINNHLLETGIQGIYHNITPQQTQLNNSEILYSIKSFPISKSYEMSGFVSLKMLLRENLFMDAGLRVNLFKQDKALYHDIDPRLSMSYQIRENNYFRLNLSRQSQYLHFLTTSSVGIPIDFWLSSSEVIPPQTCNEISTGYTHSFFQDKYEFSVDIFYKQMYNLSEYQQNLFKNDNQPVFEEIFLGKGKAYGIEFFFKKNVGKLTGWFAYALGRADRKFEELNDGKTFPARFDRRHDFSLAATYEFSKRWDFSLIQVFATGNAYTIPDSWYFINNTPIKQYGNYNGARMPDYNRTDISVNYWFKENNGINLSIYNVFMVKNPVYIFINPSYVDEKGILSIKVKQKNLSTIIPSISWRFKF